MGQPKNAETIQNETDRIARILDTGTTGGHGSFLAGAFGALQWTLGRKQAVAPSRVVKSKAVKLPTWWFTKGGA